MKFLTLLYLSLFVSAFGEEENMKTHDAHTTARIHSSVTQAQRGQNFSIVLELTPDDGWHTYWRNPGDAGLPTEIKLTLNDGLKSYGLEYPIPKKKSASGIESYYYDHQVFHFNWIELPKDFQSDTIDITAEVSWMACNKDACVPGQATFKLPTIKVVDDIAIATKSLEGMNEALATLPKTWKYIEETATATPLENSWLISFCIQDFFSDANYDADEVYPITPDIIPMGGKRSFRKLERDGKTYAEFTLPRNGSSTPEEIELLLGTTFQGRPIQITAKVKKS